jgi:hypothetical protein
MAAARLAAAVAAAAVLAESERRLLSQVLCYERDIRREVARKLQDGPPGVRSGPYDESFITSWVAAAASTATRPVLLDKQTMTNAVHIACPLCVCPCLEALAGQERPARLKHNRASQKKRPVGQGGSKDGGGSKDWTVRRHGKGWQGRGVRGRKGDRGYLRRHPPGHTYTPDGLQVCFAWQSSGSCLTQCGRVHVCEQCLGPHPAFCCTVTQPPATLPRGTPAAGAYLTQAFQ